MIYLIYKIPSWYFLIFYISEINSYLLNVPDQFLKYVHGSPNIFYDGECLVLRIRSAISGRKHSKVYGCDNRGILDQTAISNINIFLIIEEALEWAMDDEAATKNLVSTYHVTESNKKQSFHWHS